MRFGLTTNDQSIETRVVLGYKGQPQEDETRRVEEKEEEKEEKERKRGKTKDTVEEEK